MNMDDLSYVEFGDVDGLGVMLFENGVQHKLFYEQLADRGILIPQYPIIDADPDNLDDWLFVHNQEHERLANQLNLDNPFQLINADWQVENDFYDWLGVHLSIHEQIVKVLKL
jgi:lysophospholipase L1-like esterase